MPTYFEEGPDGALREVEGINSDDEDNGAPPNGPRAGDGTPFTAPSQAAHGTNPSRSTAPNTCHYSASKPSPPFSSAVPPFVAMPSFWPNQGQGNAPSASSLIAAAAAAAAAGAAAAAAMHTMGLGGWSQAPNQPQAVRTKRKRRQTAQAAAPASRRRYHAREEAAPEQHQQSQQCQTTASTSAARPTASSASGITPSTAQASEQPSRAAYPRESRSDKDGSDKSDSSTTIKDADEDDGDQADGTVFCASVRCLASDSVLDGAKVEVVGCARTARTGPDELEGETPSEPPTLAGMRSSWVSEHASQSTSQPGPGSESAKASVSASSPELHTTHAQSQQPQRQPLHSTESDQQQQQQRQQSSSLHPSGFVSASHRSVPPSPAHLTDRAAAAAAHAPHTEGSRSSSCSCSSGSASIASVKPTPGVQPRQFSPRIDGHDVHITSIPTAEDLSLPFDEWMEAELDAEEKGNLAHDVRRRTVHTPRLWAEEFDPASAPDDAEDEGEEEEQQEDVDESAVDAEQDGDDEADDTTAEGDVELSADDLSSAGVSSRGLASSSSPFFVSSACSSSPSAQSPSKRSTISSSYSGAPWHQSSLPSDHGPSAPLDAAPSHTFSSAQPQQQSAASGAPQSRTQSPPQQQHPPLHRDEIEISDSDSDSDVQTIFTKFTKPFRPTAAPHTGSTASSATSSGSCSSSTPPLPRSSSSATETATAASQAEAGASQRSQPRPRPTGPRRRVGTMRCKFFATPSLCPRGLNCDFLHVGDIKGMPLPRPAPSDSFSSYASSSFPSVAGAAPSSEPSSAGESKGPRDNEDLGDTSRWEGDPFGQGRPQAHGNGIGGGGKPGFRSRTRTPGSKAHARARPSSKPFPAPPSYAYSAFAADGEDEVQETAPPQGSEKTSSSAPSSLSVGQLKRALRKLGVPASRVATAVEKSELEALLTSARQEAEEARVRQQAREKSQRQEQARQEQEARYRKQQEYFNQWRETQNRYHQQQYQHYQQQQQQHDSHYNNTSSSSASAFPASSTPLSETDAIALEVKQWCEARSLQAVLALVCHPKFALGQALPKAAAALGLSSTQWSGGWFSRAQSSTLSADTRKQVKMARLRVHPDRTTGLGVAERARGQELFKAIQAKLGP